MGHLHVELRVLKVIVVGQRLADQVGQHRICEHIFPQQIAESGRVGRLLARLHVLTRQRRGLRCGIFFVDVTATQCKGSGNTDYCQ